MKRRGSEESLKKDFEALVRPNEDVLFAGALRFTGNRADAEDLLQETYMRAFIGFKRSQDIGKPRAWLFKIMTNTYINRYHKRRREPTRVSYEEGMDHLIDDVYAPPVDNPQERFFSRLFDGEVEEALNALPEQFREAVILCDISGLTYEEISDVLGCPLGTVRSRISRGREMLFHKLYDYARERNLIRKGEKGRQGKEWTAAKPGG
ncbi:MAG: sigma-70 family RNA polymerase sigma factor [Planctomycetota bacterium]|jgi:RNA polymerase sigma-70 factor (ECF subfamily)